MYVSESPVAAGDLGVERGRVVGAQRVERVDDVLEVELEVLRDPRHGRFLPVFVGQASLGVTDFQRPFLGAARDVDRPSAVAEIATHLAEDCRHGERLERSAALEVETLEGFDEPEVGDLLEVLERLGGAAVAPREVTRERRVGLDERVAGAYIALHGPAANEFLLSIPTRGRRPNGACSCAHRRLPAVDLRAESAPRRRRSIATPAPT